MQRRKKTSAEREEGCEDHMTLGVHCVCVLGQVEWEMLMEKQNVGDYSS